MHQAWCEEGSFAWQSVISYESESRSVVSNSLQPHGLYSPWNSPGQNTGVGSHSLQGIFLTQGSNPGLIHCRWILYQLSYQGSPRILEWVADPFSSGSSQPRNQLGSPALQADSLPAELPGKPYGQGQIKEKSHRGVWLGTGLPIIHQQQSGTEIGRNREIPQAHLVTQPESLVSFKGLQKSRTLRSSFLGESLPSSVLCQVTEPGGPVHIYTHTHTLTETNQGKGRSSETVHKIIHEPRRSWD